MPGTRKSKEPHGTVVGYTVDDGSHRSTSHGRNKPAVEPNAPDDRVPALEVQVVRHRSASAQGPWKTVDLWTKNRVYVLDANFVCVEVTDRRSGEATPDHPFLGLKLVGGQVQQDREMELSYPFPRPGSEAVFEKPQSRAANYARTSTVLRVVLRIHIVTISPRYADPTWEEITGSFELPSETR